MKTLTCNSKMPFGVYKGRKMKDIPVDYFIHIYRNNVSSKAVNMYIEKAGFDWPNNEKYYQQEPNKIKLTTPREMLNTDIEKETKKALELFEKKLKKQVKNKEEYSLIIRYKCSDLVCSQIKELYKKSGWNVLHINSYEACVYSLFPETRLILENNIITL